ncbi:MAG: hypothetical protein C0594_08785 [Marinilabiliales bacterium]|nr:MAG: hypothetical protein C0594_08785 [Marinilabiliales bacterium]
MKRILLIAVIALTTGFVYAQEMTVGTKLVGVGVGQGWSYNANLVTGGLSPAVRGTFDLGMFEIEPGVITIGGQIGYLYEGKYEGVYYDYSYSNIWPYYNYSAYNYKWTYHSLLIAARSAWHYNFGQLGIRELSAYAGVAAGLRYQMVIESIDSNMPAGYGGATNSAKPYFSSYLGAYYYLTPDIAGFAEVGYGISWLTIGFNFRLK